MSHKTQLSGLLSRLSIAMGMTILLMTAGINANAQEWKMETRVNVLFGLNQPLLTHGFNIESNFVYHRWIFDYSHGVSLKFDSSLVTDDLRRQGLVVRMPWTTGFGIGYRFAQWINVRVEPKWHRFEFFYKNDPQTSANQITAFDAFSLGVGVYGCYLPFKRKDNFLRGIMLSPSVRYWPTLISSVSADGYRYANKYTGSSETIKKLNAGFGFTPWIVNLSVGYSFQIKKTKA